MLFDIDSKGKCNWVTNVRSCLCEHGFGYTWAFQEVGDETVFLRNFRQRLIDTRWQNWESHIQTSNRFEIFRAVNSSHYIRKYMMINIDRHLRFILTRFRFGNSEIKVHMLRYKQANGNELTCPLCKEADEDEVHFVLVCPVLKNVRVRYIPEKYYKYPCLFRLCLLMASENEAIIRNVAMYLYKAFKVRETLC